MQKNVIKISKGLDIPLKGNPEKEISDSGQVNEVAVLGSDYIGLKPKLLIEVGDEVKLGDALLFDKNNEKVPITAPASGKIKAVNRGEKRVLESIVIEVNNKIEEKSFESFSFLQNRKPDRETVLTNLLETGLWTSFRMRPFSKVANPDKLPRAVFVNAMDSNPLAPDVSVIINSNKDEFVAGLKVLNILFNCKICLCSEAGKELPELDIENVEHFNFMGKHPAGLVGTHIHFIYPANVEREVWHLSANDLIAIGQFFLTGKIPKHKIVSLGGSMVKKPRLIRTRYGASIKDITDFELQEGDKRIFSGSVLSGHVAEGNFAYLGRYQQQISVVPNELTTLNGKYSSIIAFDIFEKVSPLNILPIPLLKSLAILDTDAAQDLGCLELDEEDVALFSYVCPSKNNYGKLLRATLNKIEKEG